MIVTLIIELVLGAIGGWGTGQFVKQTDMGMTGNLVAGAIGGIVGPWILGYIPGLASLVSGYVGGGIGALICGVILTVIAGLIKNNMAKA